MAEFKRDCKSFPGNYVCDIMYSENQRDCTDCIFYEPISKKILLIKLGAMGDVVRTTPVLLGLKKKYGNNIHVTWLVKEESLPLLKNNPGINKILPYNQENIFRLKHEKFDVLINLDLEPSATLTANEVKADEKYGYYFNEDGHPSPFNKSAEYYLHRALSNHINKENRKTYQEMMFEIAELDYNKEIMFLDDYKAFKKIAEEFIEKNLRDNTKKIIGINVGSAGKWPSKAWHPDKIIEFVKKANDQYKIILLGGPEEKKLIPEIINRLNELEIKGIPSNNTDNSIEEFIQLLNVCDLVITGDSLAMHMSVALNKKVVSLFFCTPPWEIEPYNNIEKIQSPLLMENYYIDYLDEDLTKSISADEVLKKCQKQLQSSVFSKT